MPRLRAVPRLSDGPFRGTTAVRDGLLTRHELYGPAWQRLLPDVYVRAGTRVDHAVRVRAATVLLPSAVITGSSAAWVWDVDVDGPDGAARAEYIEVSVPPGPDRRVPGLRMRRRVVDPAQVLHVPWVGGAAVSAPVWTALDLASDTRRSLVEAVVVLDQFVAAGRATLAGLHELAAGWSGRGCRLLVRAVAAADGLAGSPPETRLRLELHASGLPRPVAQFVLRSADGRRVKALDFAWPHLRFAIEYDGAVHVASSTRPESRFHLPKDRRVLNQAQELGWRIFYVTAPDGHDMSGLATRIDAAVRARAVELGVPLHPGSPSAS